MSTFELPKLPCCRPTAYDGASTTLVHAYYCDKAPGDSLSVDEWASIRVVIERPEIESRERAAAVTRHPVSYRRRKPTLIYCRCSSPVLPCPVHKDRGEDWWDG